VFSLRYGLNFKTTFRLALLIHPNVFTFILLLSERRAGIAWEPSNNMMLILPPEIKCLLLLPIIFSLTPLFYCPSELSVFGFKWLISVIANWFIKHGKKKKNIRGLNFVTFRTSWHSLNVLPQKMEDNISISLFILYTMKQLSQFTDSITAVCTRPQSTRRLYGNRAGSIQNVPFP
jgi:hypothetical protein